MNRTDRLYAVAEELRRSGRRGTTGARLARLLEVSERTIKRDIGALQEAGAPIWAQAGPGGGYVLDESASLPPVNFTPNQAVAVAVALAAMPAGSPFAVDGAAARGKVFDALSPADRARAADVAGRVWFAGPPTASSQPGSSGSSPLGSSQPGSQPGSQQGTEPASQPGSQPAASPPVLRAVEGALSRHLVLALTYRDRRGVVTRRHVEPILLARTEEEWFLVAWARDRAAVRWFRLRAIAQADVTRARFAPRAVSEVGRPPDGAGPALAHS